MKSIHANEESPDDSGRLNEARIRIVEFWNRLSVIDDSGGTTWEVLDQFKMQVTGLLGRGDSRSIRKAERLTAEAIYLLQYGGPG